MVFVTSFVHLGLNVAIHHYMIVLSLFNVILLCVFFGSMSYFFLEYLRAF